MASSLASPLGVNKKVATSGCVTAHEDAYFCSYLRALLSQDPGFSSLGATPDQRAETLKQGGLTIHTTLDGDIQAAAQKAVLDRVPIADPSGAGAASVTIEPGTGKVLSMVQNRDYYPGTAPGQTVINYNVDQEYGSGDGFQTGSTFKPFTLATWLAKGKGLYDVIDATRRTHSFSEFQSCNGPLGGQTWNPANSEGTEGGEMTVLDATRLSVNAAYVDMATQLSLCDIAATATKLGVHKAYAYNGGDCQNQETTALPDCTPSMVLGSMQIAPITMAAAYAAFADDGTYCAPIVVSSIIDRNGKSLAVPASSCNQAIDPNVALGVTYALKTVLESGTAAGNGIGRPAAGKTGTTDGSVDTWFIGYTPQRATAVWVGYNPDPGKDGRADLKDIEIGGRYYSGQVFGATIAAPIWHDIMEVASDGLPAKDWPDPSGKILSGSSVAVPDVTGEPIDQATGDLQSAGFQVTVGTPVPSSLTPDLVADTSPAPGSRVAPKSTITLLPGDGSGGGQAGTPNGKHRHGHGRQGNGAIQPPGGLTILTPKTPTPKATP